MNNNINRSRYAIITPAGVIRFRLVPETLMIAYLNEGDAISKNYE